MEIDLEILDMLSLNASAKTTYWSAKSVLSMMVPVQAPLGHRLVVLKYTKSSWFQTLGIKIQSVSNAIHQKTLRGGANFVVVSPETAYNLRISKRICC